jgi:hypothetical protein
MRQILQFFSIHSFLHMLYHLINFHKYNIYIYNNHFAPSGSQRCSLLGWQILMPLGPTTGLNLIAEREHLVLSDRKHRKQTS